MKGKVRRGEKPKALVLAGEEYVPVVLQVTEKDELGRPLACRLVRDDESVHIEGGEEFLIVYASKKAIGTGPSHKGEA